MLRIGAPVLDPVEAEEVDVVLHLRAKSLAVRDVAAAQLPRRRVGDLRRIHTAHRRSKSHHRELHYTTSSREICTQRMRRGRASLVSQRRGSGGERDRYFPRGPPGGAPRARGRRRHHGGGGLARPWVYDMTWTTWTRGGARGGESRGTACARSCALLSESGEVVDVRGGARPTAHGGAGATRGRRVSAHKDTQSRVMKK